MWSAATACSLRREASEASTKASAWARASSTCCCARCVAWPSSSRTRPASSSLWRAACRMHCAASSSKRCCMRASKAAASSDTSLSFSSAVATACCVAAAASAHAPLRRPSNFSSASSRDIPSFTMEACSSKTRPSRSWQLASRCRHSASSCRAKSSSRSAVERALVFRAAMSSAAPVCLPTKSETSRSALSAWDRDSPMCAWSCSSSACSLGSYAACTRWQAASSASLQACASRAPNFCESSSLCRAMLASRPCWKPLILSMAWWV
mmetsp:Transcript_104702/g.291618  ORF Transcript_104702/g.291618 Transcript_104702/m.291618 type:complete len:267 (+) Transcript_104702:1179-1979(+)